MKEILLCLFAFGLCNSLAAQPFKVEKSALFEEPDVKWSNILQLNNGATFFFYKDDEEINMIAYDKSRKLVAKRAIKSSRWLVDKHTSVSGVYEINGEPVLFIVTVDDRIPTLRRIRLDPVNGVIIKDDEIGHLGEQPRSWIQYDMYQMSVFKDKASDCYAVIFLEFYPKGGSDLKVYHFDGTHKKINTTNYNTKGEAERMLSRFKAVVDGNRCVYMLSSVGRLSSMNEGTSSYMLSKLVAGDSMIKNRPLETNVEFSNSKEHFFYNSESKQLQLEITTLVDTKRQSLGNVIVNYYGSLFFSVNSNDLSVKSVKSLTGDQVSAYAQKHIDEDYSYSGVPWGVVQNTGNTFTVLMEKSEVLSGKSIKGAIGVSVISGDGTEIAGYVISKKQVLFSNLDNDQFMSFDYVNAAGNNYIIFNDNAANFDKEEADTKHRKMRYASLSDALCFRLKGDSIERFFLFEESTKSSAFCYIKGNSYNDQLNTYATIMIEREGREKQARLAWVTFK